ncbi:MAG: NAD(P)(+) transhydrogenase (Re/Si-specific) subunit beta, partial [Actinomycetales bacterium]
MTAAGVATAAAAEPTAIPVWAQLGYLVAAVCFILALRGLSSPRTARSGNLIGAAGAALAVLIVLTSEHLDHLVLILAAVVVGTALGVPAARRVAMTQMPQLVALFNGVGGAAAALVAVLELADAPGTQQSVANRLAVAFTILVGTVSLAGSVLTFAKLQELMTTRPVVIAGAQIAMVVSVVAALALAVVVVTTGALWAALVLGLVGLLLGLQVVLPVGGADVPIVISLLNAFTGLTVAASGYLLGNPLLLVAGTLVGASGTILTRLMASAMGRSVVSILFGAFRGGSTAGSTEVSNRPVRSASAEDVAILLAYARKVIVVPGYGLAVAQAQHTIRELAEVLESKGIEVIYAIHPVAGRMPGHMNVLLAEADVPYDHLKEMDDINGDFPQVDVSL